MLSVKARIFIPTLYFVEGLPYTIVTIMSVVMFKTLGASNEYIGVVTSNLAWPWVVKLFWAPMIDLVGTRRAWILVAHAVLAVLSALLAFGIMLPDPITIALVLFVIMAIVSATQDVAIDGYYMDVLDKQRQALYVGIRNAAYKIAFLTGSGALVYLSGRIAETHGVKVGWAAAFGVCAALLALAFAFHSVALPRTKEAHAQTDPSKDALHQMKGQFSKVFATFFTQPKALIIIVYILIFRLGDALMLKMAQPFLLDPPEKGGLGISTENVGLIYGTVGMTFLLIGGIVGSWIVSRFGLKRCLLPTAILQNLAIPLYWVLAVTKPSLPAAASGSAGAALHAIFSTVSAVNAFEQFSYGLGTAAYTVYLLSVVKPEFKASHYAISTGLMALGLMVPGTLSGFIQTQLGYANFFLTSFLVSIPGIITIWFLPFKESNGEQSSSAGE